MTAEFIKRKNFIISILIFFFITIPLTDTKAVSDDWLDGWSFRKKITIDKTSVSSDLNDFPLYIRIYDDKDIGDNSQNDGDDIRFTSSNGTTTLPFDLEKWTGGEGASTTADFWVKIPTIQTATNTEMFIYYGSTTASSAVQATTTWNNGYIGVYHLSENAGDTTVANSASTTVYSGSSARNTSLIASSTGRVDGSFTLNGTSDYINIGDISQITNASTLSYEAWVKPTALQNWRAVIAKQSASTYTTYTVMQLTGVEGDGGANDVIVCVSNGAQSCGHTASQNLISTYVNHHWLMVFDGNQTGNSNRLKFYLDGVQKSLTFIGSAVPATTASLNVPVYIGNAGADGLYFPGVIDEVRISTTTRSADWVYFQVQNISSADNELTFGTEEDDVAPIVSISSATANSQNKITVIANVATDSGVGLHTTPYQFQEISGNSGGSSSDWQSSNIFEDTDLACGNTYTYKVRAKDASDNISDYSSSFEIQTGACEQNRSGNSIQSQVRNLIAMGQIERAEQLKKQWYFLFEDENSQITSTDKPTEQKPKPEETTKLVTANNEKTFERNLYLGISGHDVKSLQQFLNQKGFGVATSGPGSIGQETEFFGLNTKSALTKFQKTNNIYPAYGFFGPITRENINNSINK